MNRHMMYTEGDYILRLYRLVGNREFMTCDLTAAGISGKHAPRWYLNRGVYTKVRRRIPHESGGTSTKWVYKLDPSTLRICEEALQATPVEALA